MSYLLTPTIVIGNLILYFEIIIKMSDLEYEEKKLKNKKIKSIKLYNLFCIKK